jgi:outer membrane protein OmpA-like peptidoglycan-associated protein
MIRLLLLILFIAAGAAMTFGLKSCADRRPVDATPAVNFNSEVAILGDGTPIFAPNGTIGRTLADWLRDPESTRRYFEVGGEQFPRNAIDPLPAAKARLTRLAAMLQAYPDAQVQVVGFAAPSRDAASDARLAELRSQRVVDLLAEGGVRRSRLSIADHSRGFVEPSKGTTPDRVGFLLIYPKRPQPAADPAARPHP